MPPPRPIGLEQARATLPDLVTAALSGRSHVITRHSKPVAALVPLAQLTRQRSAAAALLSLRGSGRGLWGPDVATEVDALRAEWD